MLECWHSLRREGCGGLASDFPFEIIRGLVRIALEQNWGLRDGGWNTRKEIDIVLFKLLSILTGKISNTK